MSRFTNTPVEVTLKVVEERLNKDKSLTKRTKLTVEDIIKLLNFITKSTYFTFQGKLYCQIESFAMGDPLSAIMSNFFMEDLEQKVIPSAPGEVCLTLWQRYVDDILEMVKRGKTQIIMEHLNTIHTTGNIKFTHEEEDCSLAFLDVKVHHIDDGPIKLSIYRKPTHTDQYLLWSSEHPTVHKMSLIRLLMDRAHSVITDEEEIEKEEKHTNQALKMCQYPDWTFNKTKERMEEAKSRGKNTKRIGNTEPGSENRGMVTLPYIKGVTEHVQKVMGKYRIQAPVKPHLKTVSVAQW